MQRLIWSTSCRSSRAPVSPLQVARTCPSGRWSVCFTCDTRTTKAASRHASAGPRAGISSTCAPRTASKGLCHAIRPTGCAFARRLGKRSAPGNCSRSRSRRPCRRGWRRPRIQARDRCDTVLAKLMPMRPTADEMARAKLAACARAGLVLKYTYEREGNDDVAAGGYAHAKQFRRCDESSNGSAIAWTGAARHRARSVGSIQ